MNICLGIYANFIANKQTHTLKNGISNVTDCYNNPEEKTFTLPQITWFTKLKYSRKTLIVVDFKINYKISNKLRAYVLFVYKTFINKSPTESNQGKVTCSSYVQVYN